MYNDIGIQVRDKMILLIEAQSTFSVNIVLIYNRFFFQLHLQIIQANAAFAKDIQQS